MGGLGGHRKYGGCGRDPTSELVVSWAVKCYWMLDNEKCKNAWKKKGFEWVIN